MSSESKSGKMKTGGRPSGMLRLMLGMLVVAAVGLVASETLDLVPQAEASHGRYAHLTWTPVNETTVDFTFQAAWRHDGYSGRCVNLTNPSSLISCSGDDGLPEPGDIISENVGGTDLRTGDGRTISSPTGRLLFLVTDVNRPNNDLFSTALDPESFPDVDTRITHDYGTGTGNFTAFVDDCCRISGFSAPNNHVNNPNDNYRFETLVQLGDINTPPTSTMSPIQQCPIEGECAFTVPANDPDGDPLRFRLSTSSEAVGGLGFVQPGPPDSNHSLEINATTGQVTWNTTGAEVHDTLNTLYSMQIMVEDLDGMGAAKSHVPVDLFIHLVENITARPQFVHPPTPVCSSIIEVDVGQPLSFVVEATAEGNQSVQITASGVPAGATFTTVQAGNPTQRQFNWTPADFSALQPPPIIQFQARDDAGLTDSCPVTIAQRGVDLEVVQVEVVSLDGAPDAFHPGDDIQVRAHVRNNGAGTIPDAEVVLDLDGEPTTRSHAWGPAQTRVLTLHASDLAPGLHQVTVQADPDDGIEEFDEANNEGGQAFVASGGLEVLGVSSVTFEELGALHAPDHFVPGERITLRFDGPPGHTDLDDLEVRLGGQQLEVVANGSVGASHYADIVLPAEMTPTRDRVHDVPRHEEVHRHRLVVQSGGMSTVHLLPVVHHGAKVGLAAPALGLEEAGTGITRMQAIGALAVAFVDQGVLVPTEDLLHGDADQADLFYRIAGGSADSWRTLTLRPAAGHTGFATGAFLVTGDEAGAAVRLLLAEAPVPDAPVPRFLPSSGSAPLHAYLPERTLSATPLLPDLEGNLTVNETYLVSGTVQDAALPDPAVEWATLVLDVDEALFATGPACLQVPLAGDRPHAYAFAVRPLAAAEDVAVRVEAHAGKHCAAGADGMPFDGQEQTLDLLATGPASDDHLEAVLEDRVTALADGALRAIVGNDAWRQHLLQDALSDHLVALGAEGMDAEAIVEAGLTPAWLTDEGLAHLLEHQADGDAALEALGINATDPANITAGVAALSYTDLGDVLAAYLAAGDLGSEVAAHLLEAQAKVDRLQDAVEGHGLWSGGAPHVEATPAALQELASRWDAAAHGLQTTAVRTGEADSRHDPPLATPPRPGATDCLLSTCWDTGEALPLLGADPNLLADATDTYRVFSQSVAAKHAFAPLGDLQERMADGTGLHGDLDLVPAALAAEPRSGLFAAWSAGFNATRLAPHAQALALLDDVDPARQTGQHGFVAAGATQDHTHTAPALVERVNVTLTSFGGPLGLEVGSNGTLHTAGNATQDPLHRDWIELDTNGTVEIAVHGAANATGYLLQVREVLAHGAREVHVVPVSSDGLAVEAAQVLVEGPASLPVEVAGGRHSVLAANGTALDIHVEAPGHAPVDHAVLLDGQAARVLVALELEPLLSMDPIEIVVGKPETLQRNLTITGQGPAMEAGALVMGPAGDIASATGFFIPANGTANVTLDVETGQDTPIGTYPGEVRLIAGGATVGSAPIVVHVEGPEIAVSDPFVRDHHLNGTTASRTVWFENQGFQNATQVDLAQEVPAWISVALAPDPVPAVLEPGDRVNATLEADLPAGQAPSLHHGWLALTTVETRPVNVTLIHATLGALEETANVTGSGGDLDGDGGDEHIVVRLEDGGLFLGVEKNGTARFGLLLGNISVDHETTGEVIDTSGLEPALSGLGGAGAGDQVVMQWSDGGVTLERTVELVAGADGLIEEIKGTYLVTGVDRGQVTFHQEHEVIGGLADGSVHPEPDNWSGRSPALWIGSSGAAVGQGVLSWTATALSPAQGGFSLQPQAPLTIAQVWADAAALGGTTVSLEGVVAGVYEDRFVLADGTGAILVHAASVPDAGRNVTVNATVDGSTPELRLVSPTIVEDGLGAVPDGIGLPSDPAAHLLDNGHVRILAEGSTVDAASTTAGFLVGGREVPLYNWHRVDTPRIQDFENLRVTGFLFHGPLGTGLLVDTVEKLPFYVGDITLDGASYHLEDLPTFVLEGSLLLEDSELIVRNTDLRFGPAGSPHRIELTQGSRLVLQNATAASGGGHVHLVLDATSEVVFLDGDLNVSSYLLEAGGQVDFTVGVLSCTASGAPIVNDTVFAEDRACGALPAAASGGGGGGGTPFAGAGRILDAAVGGRFNAQGGSTVHVPRGLPEGVEAIDVRFADDCFLCAVRASVSDAPPADATPDGFDVAWFLTIDVLHREDDRSASVESATVTFTMPPGTPTSQVVLLRAQEDWRPLDAVLVDADADPWVFRAEVPGFSTFAVALDAAPPRITDLRIEDGVLHGAFSDNRGVDPGPLRLVVDGAPVAVEVTEEGLRAELPDLEAGDHQAVLTVVDASGHEASETLDFQTAAEPVTPEEPEDVPDETEEPAITPAEPADKERSSLSLWVTVAGLLAVVALLGSRRRRGPGGGRPRP